MAHQVVYPDKFAFIDQALAERSQTRRLRSLYPLYPEDAVYVLKQEQRLLNFSSNDYLGLSKHPLLIRAAQHYISQYGTGATASRLVAGTYDIHQQIEQKLAVACGREAALVFTSGFQANSTILVSLLDRQSLVLCDRLIHNSLIQGILASRATFIRYRHNDLNHLEELLKQAIDQSYSRILIVTETVFSMDGDRSNIDVLIQLAQQYNTILYLDDAHAVGVLGKNGMGLAAYHPEIDVVVGTFGKAFGSFGAFVTCSKKLRDYFINFCPGFIYTTALPPGVMGAIEAALELMPMLDQDRFQLSQNANHLCAQFQQIGYNIGASNSQIIPLYIGDEAKTLRLSQWLEEQGILAIAIRPPTVPSNTSRIRFALSSQHRSNQLDYLVHTIRSWHEH
ncbi:MAG: 8-amino-7-oxononanoate synthase [Cyanobacteria bacterium RU_5_0]|nr:8-amino-7-oxononanoate synthase [Cyanobacteria bacterium RU_5_0]